MKFVLITFLLSLTVSVFSQENISVDSINEINDSIELSSKLIDTTIKNSKFIKAIGYQNWKNNDIIYKPDTNSHKFDSIPVLLIDTAIAQVYTHPFLGVITSHFGYRRYRQHYGIDIDLVTGDSVRAAFDGKVRITKYNRGFGKVVVIRHENGLETIYAHLSKFLIDTNQMIKSGNIIALGGNTGRSTGSHLHFEVRYMGKAMDPEGIIDFDKGTLINNEIVINNDSFDYMKRLAADKNAKYHYIHKGDTLSAIAKRYKTRVSKLCYYNGINQTAILQIGQKLRIR